MCYFHLLVAADRCTARFTVSWPHADYACNKRANRMSEREGERVRQREVVAGTPTRAGQVTNWPTDCFFAPSMSLTFKPKLKLKTTLKQQKTMLKTKAGGKKKRAAKRNNNNHHANDKRRIAQKACREQLEMSRETREKKPKNREIN